MTDEDVNKIGGLVDSKLEAFREDIKGDINSALKPVNEKLDAHGKILNAQGKKLDILWDQVERVTVNLEKVSETQDLHTAVLKRIETKVEGNSDDIKKVDKRLTKVENRLGIVPPPELIIVR